MATAFLDVVEVSDDNEVDVLLGNGSGPCSNSPITRPAETGLCR